MTDPELLETAGRALYGADWHRGLARALEVNDSSVRNWMHGRNAVPPGIWDELSRLLEARARAIVDVLALVDASRARLWASKRRGLPIYRARRFMHCTALTAALASIWI